MGCVMESYKIRVNNEAESKEAQELFFELGYEKSKQCNWLIASCIQFLATDGGYLHCWDDEKFGGNRFEGLPHKELTLPQLRDLVVLKRNDVKDANYKSATDFYYVTVENQYYFWNGFAWCLSDVDFIIGLSPIIDNPENKRPSLISGADALRALADGVKPEEIEGRFSSGIETYFLSMDGKVDVFLKYLDKKLFRIKPQTVKVELEIHKPFEPKEDCHVYILDDGKTDGYRRYFYEVHGDRGNEFIGIWKTEDEIKQVVEQLRKIKGAV